jgi:hypothetical protein
LNCSLHTSHDTYLALLVMLQQVLAAGAAWVGAVGVVALQDVRPQLLAHPTAAAELALCLVLLALGAMPQEQQPPLLLLDVLLPLVQTLVGVVVADATEKVLLLQQIILPLPLLLPLVLLLLLCLLPLALPWLLLELLHVAAACCCCYRIALHIHAWYAHATHAW